MFGFLWLFWNFCWFFVVVSVFFWFFSGVLIRKHLVKSSPAGWKVFLSTFGYGANWNSLMENKNLRKMAVELRGVAMEVQPLSFAEVVAEDEDEL